MNKSDLSAQVFSSLEGRPFRDYDEFERVIVEEFNKRVMSFPPGYSYRDLIRWGDRNNWIIENGNGDGIRIQVH